MSLEPGTRLRVLRGRPTREQIAGLVLAVDQLVTEPAPRGPQPGWRRAARMEAVGAPPFEGANDPRLHDRRGSIGR